MNEMLMKKILMELSVALRVTLSLLLACSLAYPLLVWVGGQACFHKQANGSLLYDANGEVIGSELIGQVFNGDRYFNSRPSVAGKGYDATSSSGSNLGPTSKALYDLLTKNLKTYREENGLHINDEVPADAVTASGSGLDPHISPANAYLQAPHVARARSIAVDELYVLIDQATAKRDWGIFGEPRVNVLELNLALELIHQQERGRLKLYLGSSAGVGKTFAMLVEGNRLKEQGVDVVIGYVEPHARPETIAQIGSLEMVPPLTTTHAGITLKELDLAAVLQRKPYIVLIDELAHTNAPGLQHAKRYEDVETLRHAGIHVISTLNIQHLESLYEVVEKSTGVKVQERIPDNVVATADQIVNIDIEAEDLIARLAAGKIYPSQVVETALQNFFTIKNLTQLREITLNEIAQFLDRRQRVSGTSTGQINVLGKVMVALSSRGPDPAGLLRTTSRLAANLNAPWYAVYVRTKKEAGKRLDSETHRILAQTLDIAQKMGGSIILLENKNVAQALCDFAKENSITHLIIGRSLKQHWFRWKPGLVDILQRQLPDVAIVLNRC
jgi:two-component system, OmpR family, sensor histidine kinase KdpD